jgi:riboflavin synthase
MFTGIIEGIGKVKAVQRLGQDLRIAIQPPFDAGLCQIGESVAVDGVCLTVTAIAPGTLNMDVSGETLSHSTLGKLTQGDAVNLERALRLDDRLGGHLVMGHVDDVGKILKKERRQRSWFLRIGIDEHLSRYTIEKGSIAVDGISLTINDCGDQFFEVNIIPQTAQATRLLTKQVGDLVNIETDLIGKYVEKFFVKYRPASGEQASPRIDMEMLTKHGFGD